MQHIAFFLSSFHFLHDSEDHVILIYKYCVSYFFPFIFLFFFLFILLFWLFGNETARFALVNFEWAIYSQSQKFYILFNKKILILIRVYIEWFIIHRIILWFERLKSRIIKIYKIIFIFKFENFLNQTSKFFKQVKVKIS